MRVLLTGSTGRLGGAFLSLWGSDPDIDLIAPSRQEMDLSEPGAVRTFLGDLDFDVLINTAAVTGLEQCLDDPELAQRVNVDAALEMAEVCREKSAKLVHFSTDYVFSGELPGMRTEADPAEPVNVYGRSKREGETAVLAANGQSLVARVSWLFGPSTPQRPSHFDNVLNRLAAGKREHFISDKFSMPTFTHDIVEWTRLLVAAEASGIYHLCNRGEPESWFSYAQQVCRLAVNHGYDLKEDNLLAGKLSEVSFFRERRPVHTTMAPARMMAEGIATPRHWLEAAGDYLKMR